MRVFLLILLLLLFFNYKLKKEFFCNLSKKNLICNFINIELPVERSFTLPEIREYGESRAIDIYNELFNMNNPRINDYISKDMNITDFLLDKCYIRTSNEVLGIINTINYILREFYENNSSSTDLMPINNTTKINDFSHKIKFLRYKLFNKLFDKFIYDKTFFKNVNIKMIKFHITYLLLEENDDVFVNGKLRYSVFSYLYYKNVTFFDENDENLSYQNLLLLIKDIIKYYIFSFFDKTIDDLEDLTIKKIRNLINNGEIINYFYQEKDLCYI